MAKNGNLSINSENIFVFNKIAAYAGYTSGFVFSRGENPPC